MKKFLWVGAAVLFCCSAEKPNTPTDLAPATQSASAPVSQAAKPKGGAGLAIPALAGRWTSDTLCLELFANGDFALSLLSEDPKIMVLGQAKVDLVGDQTTWLELTVSRIWKARWVSSCRKYAEFGHWIDSHEALGLTLQTGESVKLTIQSHSETTMTLCGEVCAPLTHAPSLLAGRWRRPELRLNAPDWKAGDLLEVTLAGDDSQLWVGGEGSEITTLSGRATVSAIDSDHFRISFTMASSDLPPGKTLPQVLGGSFSSGVARTLEVTRLPEERVQVCAGASCATLERMFNADSYNLP